MNQNDFFIYHPDKTTRLIYADYLESKGDLFLASVLREEENVPITCEFKGEGDGDGSEYGGSGSCGFGSGGNGRLEGMDENGYGIIYIFGDGYGDGKGNGSEDGFGSGKGDGSGQGSGYGFGFGCLIGSKYRKN
jgi:hypothetical protein